MQKNKKIIGIYHLSNIVSFIGMLLALLGCILIINGVISTSVLCLILSGICDLFDGVFARRFKRSKVEQLFGIQIDSLADVLNFIALPALLLYSNGPKNIVTYIVVFFYAFCAITRLAYFNVTAMQEEDTTKSIAYFQGVPVTYAAFFFPLAWLVSYIIPWEIFQYLYLGVGSILAISFICNIKIKKPQGIWYLFFILIAIVVITTILLVKP